jgi:hypothetical protein
MGIGRSLRFMGRIRKVLDAVSRKISGEEQWSLCSGAMEFVVQERWLVVQEKFRNNSGVYR